MGWVKRHLKDENVKGIIIAGRYDKKLDYALEYAPNDTEVFIYHVSFTLNEFKIKVASFILLFFQFLF